MKSTQQMLEQCEGLLGTKDVTPWEAQFLDSLLEQHDPRKRDGNLTSKQVEKLEQIYLKHFA